MAAEGDELLSYQERRRSAVAERVPEVIEHAEHLVDRQAALDERAPRDVDDSTMEQLLAARAKRRGR